MHLRDLAIGSYLYGGAGEKLEITKKTKKEIKTKVIEWGSFKSKSSIQKYLRNWTVKPYKDGYKIVV